MYYNKTIVLPRKIKLSDNADTSECLIRILDAWKKDFEILDILKKYAKNDGWSDGWTIEFWNMKPREIKKVCKWLTKKDKSEER